MVYNTGINSDNNVTDFREMGQCEKIIIIWVSIPVVGSGVPGILQECGVRTAVGYGGRSHRCCCACSRLPKAVINGWKFKLKRGWC